MAISIGLERRSGPAPFRSRFSDLGAGWVVRALLLAYLAAVVALHIVTMPTLFEIKQTGCVPGDCFWGQVSQHTLDRLDARGISPTVYALAATLVPLLIPIIGHLLAAIAVWQRPTNWLPVFFVMSIAICNIAASGALFVLIVDNPEWQRTILALHIPVVIAMPLLTLFFPTGRLIPRWGIALLGFVALDITAFLLPEQFIRLPAIFQSSLDRWVTYGELAAIPIIAWRIHVTTDRRALRQTKLWFAGQIPGWSYFAVVAFLIADEDLLYAEGSMAAIAIYFFWALGVLAAIVGFLMAIYLYNVYDLSIVIRRSIVYGLLTVALIVVYLLTVALVSTLFRSEESAVPAMLATIVIALGFAPLRTWLQRGVRGLLYGDETDPYGVLTRFGQHLETSSAPERLLLSVVELAQDALRVPGVALSVAGAPNLSVRTGEVARDALAVPVRYQGGEVGTMALSPRGPAESFSPSDHRLIDEIARQTGIAVHSTLLSESLKQSREQIVTAREEERRRIRNDLHDGLGPSLAALSLQIEIARDLISIDPDRSSKLLEEVLGQTRESILDIRRLVYDLRPPALDDLGLAGAIRAQAARWEESGIKIELDLADDLPELTAATEVALFRIAQEALANVARHAHATGARVSLRAGQGAVRLDVVDNGRGMNDRVTAGVGMRSMRERAEELGGRLTVGNRPEGGVVVTAEFDVPPNGPPRPPH